MHLSFGLSLEILLLADTPKVARFANGHLTQNEQKVTSLRVAVAICTFLKVQLKHQKYDTDEELGVA